MRQMLLPSTRISSVGASRRVRHTEIAGSKERRVSKVSKDGEETRGHKEEKEEVKKVQWKWRKGKSLDVPTFAVPPPKPPNCHLLQRRSSVDPQAQSPKGFRPIAANF